MLFIVGLFWFVVVSDWLLWTCNLIVALLGTWLFGYGCLLLTIVICLSGWMLVLIVLCELYDFRYRLFIFCFWFSLLDVVCYVAVCVLWLWFCLFEYVVLLLLFDYDCCGWLCLFGLVVLFDVWISDSIGLVFSIYVVCLLAGWLVVICYCVLPCFRCFCWFIVAGYLTFVFCFALLIVKVDLQCCLVEYYWWLTCVYCGCFVILYVWFVWVLIYDWMRFLIVLQLVVLLCMFLLYWLA